MRLRLLLVGTLAAFTLPTPAGADTPAPPPDQVEAQSRMLSGVKLFEANDYLGALVIFRGAYARFPSTKILLNIGTTLRLLDRKADAANTYQRYLDASDADPAKKAEVETAVLANLDTKVVRLDITVSPADAEVQLGDGDWQPAAQTRLARVAPGAFTVRARKTGLRHRREERERRPRRARGGDARAGRVQADRGRRRQAGRSAARPRARRPRRRRLRRRRRRGSAASAEALIDEKLEGAAALLGVIVDITGGLAVRGAAIVGPNSGGYVGATYTFLTGSWRPVVSAGMPVFSDAGVRFGLRAAGGVEIPASKHVSIVVELGYEHYLNANAGIIADRFVPALGVNAKL